MKLGSIVENWRARLRAQPDIVVALVLFVLGAAAGMAYFATWDGTPQFWQETTFTPAIMWLSGHGWHNPMVSDVPGLEDFLYSRVDAFDPAQVPPEVRLLPDDTAGMSFDEINAYHPEMQFPGFLPWQRMHLYLVLAVTACWALFGIAWSSLTPLAGLLFGTTVATAYGIFRLALKRPLAIFGALLVLTSPLHLEMVPQIRDYAKAPFILLVILLCGWLIRYPLGLRARAVIAAAAGVLTGIGLGFRMDLGICVPAVLVVIALFMREPPRLRVRAQMMTIFLACFVISGLPILIEASKESGHFAHVALLGLLERCDERLGVAAPGYNLGGPYTDFYMANIVQAHAHRTTGEMPPTWVMMPPYHEATQVFLRDYLTTFPADIVTRAYAAVFRVLDELGPNPAAPYAANIDNPFLQGLWDFRQGVLDWAPAGGRYYAAAAMLLIAAWRLRAGFGALFLLLWFAGYTAIQFNTRHAFHLEWLSWWCGLAALQILWNLRHARPPSWGWAGTRVVIFVLIVVLGLTGPLWALRAWQNIRVQNVTSILPVLESAPLDALDEGDGNIDLPEFAMPPSDLPVGYTYLKLLVAPGDMPVPITLRYDAENTEHFDYTRTVTAPPFEWDLQLFIPLYFSAESRFLGLHIPPQQRDRVTAIHTLDQGPVPIWMNWTLLDRGPIGGAYQRFTR